MLKATSETVQCSKLDSGCWEIAMCERGQRCSLTTWDLLSSSDPYPWALPELHCSCVCAWSRALWIWMQTCWLAFEAWLWTYSVTTQLIGILSLFTTVIRALCSSCLDVAGLCLWPDRHSPSVTSCSWLAFISAHSQQLIHCRLLNYDWCIFR